MIELKDSDEKLRSYASQIAIIGKKLRNPISSPCLLIAVTYAESCESFQFRYSNL